MNRPEGGGTGLVHEGAGADEAVAHSARRTTSRREMAARHNSFQKVSPEVGHLDDDELDRAFGNDADATLSLLADLTGATDVRLRELARRLAGRLVIELARRGPERRRGVGKLHLQRIDETGGDIDVDASIDGVVEARARGGAPALDDLRARSWSRPGTAWCLIIDRSGSMGGGRLAAAAVAAAAVAWRTPSDYAVLAFNSDVVVVKSQDVAKSTDRVVNDILTLRGHGTTDLALALRAAGEQLARSRAGRKIAVLLSDCRATVPGDVVAAARAHDEVVIVPPEADSAEAEALARSIGAVCVPLSGPSAVPDVFAALR